MGYVSSDRPLSESAGAQLTPAIQKIKGAFASALPGKAVQNLTQATKLSNDQLRAIVKDPKVVSTLFKTDAELKKFIGAVMTAAVEKQPAVLHEQPSEAEIQKDIRDYTRAFLTVSSSIESLAEMKKGMVKSTDQDAMDVEIEKANEQIEKLQTKLFQKIDDKDVLKEINSGFQEDYATLQTVYDQLENSPERDEIVNRIQVCEFVFGAISKRLSTLSK